MDAKFKLKPEFKIKDEQDLRQYFPAAKGLAAKKCLDRLDQHCRDFIARAPFLCIGTHSQDGSADVSPRGDAPGFVEVLDETTLLIPDRPGNNRLDTLTNILSNPSVGLLFMVPGFDETMRVNGVAELTSDPDLLARLAVRDRVPTAAIVVHVKEAFIHCAKAFRRSKLWDPEARQARGEMPSLVQIVLEQTNGGAPEPDELARLDAELEESYRRTMY